MTRTKFASYIRRLTNSNSTTYTDANLQEDANIILDELADRANDIAEDIFQEPHYASLEANRREYAYPSTIGANFIRVEANFTPDESGNPTEAYWIPLKEFDLAQYERTTDEYTITQLFGNEYGRAFFDRLRQSLWIYSGTIVAVTNGLKFWASTYPAHLDSVTGTDDMSIGPSTTERGVPRVLHKVWADGVILLRKQSKDKSKVTEVDWKLWGDRADEKLSMLQKPNKSAAVEGTIPSGVERGDYGFDY